MKELPLTEYMMWVSFLQEQQAESSGEGKNILDMDEGDMFGSLTEFTENAG